MSIPIAPAASTSTSPSAPLPATAAPAAPLPAAAKPLTPEQQTALANLHKAAKQFESLFVNMLFKSMREASPQTSIGGGKLSPAESTFSEMLDEKRSEAIADTGSFGIAKILENQLRGAVLADPGRAARARVAAPGVSL